MRKNFRIAVGLCCLLVTAATGQTNIGRNHRVIGATRHGQSAIEFDLDKDVRVGRASELEFRLPDRFAAVRLDRRHRFEERAGGGGFWRGLEDGRTDSEVMLTDHEGFLAGTIRVGGDFYEIKPTLAGQVVEKIDPSSFPACGGALDMPGVTELGAAAQATASSESRDAVGTVHTIDLLSVYTPQARLAAGGAAQITAIIQAAVDSANQAFDNSGVTAVYRLVKTSETDYADSGDLSKDLIWLAGDASTAALRNEVGADMVSLIVEKGGGYCGLGYTIRSPGAGFAGAAFQVTSKKCAVSNFSFAHENGHNLGLEHDPGNGPAVTRASYAWSFGHLVNGVFRTVMSYSSGCANGCGRVAYYSNPNVPYLGYPTGVTEANDNARTANLTAPIAAAFRAAPSSPSLTAPPAAPTGLAVTSVSEAQIGLTWVDQASDESGFRIECAFSGGSFTEIATVGAGATSFASTGLVAGTRYLFRVRAHNANGNSSYSNTASASTVDAR